MSGARGFASKVLGAMPEGVQRRVNPRKYAFTAADVPAPPVAPATDVRVYIAPVNFAAQGYAWARAIERLERVGAVSMQYRLDNDIGFPSDNDVPVAVFTGSKDWQQRQFKAVTGRFTHVLIEAERPIFGPLFGNNVRREVAELLAFGLQVGMISHGSDLRLPSRHRASDVWSPFDVAEWDLVPMLERQALEHRELLGDLEVPVFVSTPDLLLDWPTAQWLPVVVDTGKWATDRPVLAGEVPVVVHAPSSAVVKGTSLIEPIVRELATGGLIEYRQVQGVPAEEMPAVYQAADIVLDQFRLGSYGVAAVEAMAAGRLVLGHVEEQVREQVRASYGVDLPVVETTPRTIDAVLRQIVGDQDRYRALAAEGPEFVATVHDGRASAQVLEPFLRT